MQINVSFDSSVSGAPSGFQTAINYVASLYDSLFTNNVTVNIDVGWGEVGGQAMGANALGESEGFLSNVGYSATRSALIAENAPGSSTLPVSDPASNLTLLMPIAEQKALGLYTGPATDSTNPDGYVGFTAPNGYSYDFSQGVTPTNSQFYFIGVAEHEFSEVLGRVSYLNFNPGSYKSLMDLYRYSAPGARQFGENGPSYFSTDGGTTNLGDWNNYSAGNNGGDLGDWADDVVNDAFDAFSYNGVINTLSPLDQTLMNALGWTAAPSSQPLGNPGTLWLTRSGNDLLVETLGSGTTTTYSGWFSNETALSLSDGSTVGAAALANIVTAMANYQTAHPGFNPATATVMPNDATLIPALNTNWSRAINGSTGHVTIVGGFGSDTITGGTADVLDYTGSWTAVNVNLQTGSATHGTATDTLTGITAVKGSASYNDTLTAAADDLIQGGAGDDSLVATGGGDTIITGTGNATVSVGSASLESITGGGGANSINAGSGNSDTIVAGNGNQTISASGNYNSIVGGSGLDSITATGSHDTITTGVGNVTVSVGSTGSVDFITIGSGNASVGLGLGGDTVTLGTGHDTLMAGAGGGNILLVGAGVDFTAADTVNLGTGGNVVRFTSTAANDALTLTSHLTATGGTLTIVGGDASGNLTGTTALQINASAVAQAVTLQGNAGNDTLVGSAASNGTIFAGGGANSIVGGAAADSITAGNGNDTINTGSGGATVSAGNGADSLLIGNGNNSISVGNGVNSLLIGNGNNSISLGSGPDTLVLGTGADTVSATGGNDILLVGAGADYAASDTMNLGAGADTVRFTSTVANDTLSLNIHLSGGSLTVEASDAAGNLSGTTALQLSASGVAQAVTLLGNAGNDTLVGTVHSNDTLIALNGANSLIGGQGADSISTGNGNDTINTGSGNATASVGNGTDSIIVGAGNDSIRLGTGADTLALGTGAETIGGIGGNDVLLAGAGADYTAGDTVNLGAGTGVLRFTSTSANDALTLNNHFTTPGGNLTVEASNATGSLTGTTALKIDAHLVTQAITLLGNAGADTLIGTGGSNDTITAQGAHSSIMGGAGADTITGTLGDDTINAGSGNATINAAGIMDSIIGGAGLNSIVAGGNQDTITGGAGNATISSGGTANSVLLGGGNNSITLGSGGADTLSLGTGAATISATSGNDVVLVGAGVDYVSADTLNLGTGADAVRFTSTTASDVLTLNGHLTTAGGSLTVAASDASGNLTGTTALQINASAMVQAITLLGNAGADTLIGTGGSNDTITALGGANSILGSAGADSITAGNGNDTIGTGSGNATVNAGNGADSIVLGSGNSHIVLGNAADTLSLGTGNAAINASGGNDVVLVATGADYTATDALALGAGTDVVRFTSTLAGAALTLSSGLTAAGGHLTVAASSATGSLSGTTALQIDAHLLTQAATLQSNAGDDTLTAGAGGDTFAGGSGNDLFKGTAANLNGSTIVNLHPGDVLDVTNIAPGALAASFAGGSITLSSGVNTYVITSSGLQGANLTASSDGGTGTDFSLNTVVPALAVNNVGTATAGQTIALPSLVTISDSDGIGYQQLELFDSNGTAAGGEFKINGVAQTGGHEIDVSPANVANTVFVAGALNSSDTLFARLLQNNGQLTAWQQFSVTAPAPSVNVTSVASATAGQTIGLSSLMTINDPANAGYSMLQLFDSDGTVAGGEFLVNGVAQPAGRMNVLPSQVASTVFDAGTQPGTDQLYARLVESDGTITAWSPFSVTVAAPSVSATTISTATAGQAIGLSSLVTINNPANAGYSMLQLFDSNGTVGTGEFVVGGVAQPAGRLNVLPSQVASTVFDVGTYGGTDQLYARLVESDGTVTAWSPFTVTAPAVAPPTLSVASDGSALAGQTIALSSLVTINDAAHAGYSMLQLFDSDGTVAGGEFLVNGVAQPAGRITVLPSQVASTVFDAGTQPGTDQLYARLVESDGTITAWSPFSVTVAAPSVSATTISTATAGQAIGLSSLVTINDPAHAGYSMLQLFDSDGTVAGGEFLVNGVAQPAGRFTVLPSQVASTVFDAGTQPGTDQLYARLVESDGTITAWSPFSVTVAAPSVSATTISTATAGQTIGLSSLVTINNPANAGYSMLQFFDSNGTVGTGEFVVGGVAQPAGRLNVLPSQVASTVFDVGTYGGTDQLYARLVESDGTVTAWSPFTVTAPAVAPPTLSVASDGSALAGQTIALSSLVTINDAAHAGYSMLQLFDSDGTVAGGEFLVNGVAQPAGRITVLPSQVASTVFDAGTQPGTDQLYARLVESDGTITAWSPFTVTVAAPSVSVTSVVSATAGQAIGLSSLVTINDPAHAGYSMLQLFDSDGTVAGGEFLVNGVAQPAGRFTVLPSQVASTVFDAGTQPGTDQLYARLVETNGATTAWSPFAVTVNTAATLVSAMASFGVPSSSGLVAPADPVLSTAAPVLALPHH